MATASSSSSDYNNLHVAILSSPGMGHLIPVSVLAHCLALHHLVRVTILRLADSTSASANPLLLHMNHHLITTIDIPPVDISHLLTPSTKVVTQLCLMLRHAVPFIRSALSAMDHLPDALIVDHFGTDALPVAADLGLHKYVYVPSTAWFTALTLYCPILDSKISGEYIDQEEPLHIPGCKSLRSEDVVDPMMDRSDQQYPEYITMGKQMAFSDGILLNTWQDLESTTLQAFLGNRDLAKTPVYPIGPLTRPAEPHDGPQTKSDSITAWLDQQPKQSVIFVCFGSGGVLPADQTTELAWGLEMSGQRFLWVIRRPTKGQVDDAFFGSTSTNGSPDYLPEGFMSRVQNYGLVVPDWAPQREILNHPAVGGFLSHCGWNSTLESITSGVPMIAWPLYAEQKMNAAFLEEEAGVAVRPRESELGKKKMVEREEMERVVRRLMEGKEGKAMREKVEALRKSGAQALRTPAPGAPTDEGEGSSYRSMCQFLSKIAVKKYTA